MRSTSDAMVRRDVPWRAITAALGALCWTPAVLADSPPLAPHDAHSITLAKDSHVWLDGDSTLHAYRLDAKEVQVSFGAARVDENGDAGKAAGLEAFLRQGGLKTLDVLVALRGLGSGDSGLDENMRKALKADQFPQIRFLMDSYQCVPAGTSGRLSISIKGRLQIAGVQKLIEIDATAEHRRHAGTRDGQQATPHERLRRQAAHLHARDDERPGPGDNQFRPLARSHSCSDSRFRQEDLTMTSPAVEPTTPRQTTTLSAATMKAFVYHGPGKYSWETAPRPQLQGVSDAIVRMTTSTICGTDLHILKGDLPAVTDGRILGHEGIGVIEQVGTGVSEFHVGDKVILSCVTACLRCDFCRKGMYSHCRNGGWILGNLIDGTQAECVRIPHADGSLHPFPRGGDEEALVMLSDILPTGYECGVLNGQVKPGDTVAIVGAGPIGLAALLTAQFYSPAKVFMVDVDKKRLEVAKEFGATVAIDNGAGDAVAQIMVATEKEGVDVAIEAVGTPATFELCTSIVAAGGRIANIGVHGHAVTLHMERLWDRNISITTRLVDTITTPMLLKVVQSGRVQPLKLVTHRFALSDVAKAYETFGNAAKEGAIKVLLRNQERN